MTCCLTLYHTITTFNNPHMRSLLKPLWEKEKMLVTSIFSFSHNAFYPSQNTFLFFSHIYYVVCKCHFPILLVSKQWSVITEMNHVSMLIMNPCEEFGRALDQTSDFLSEVLYATKWAHGDLGLASQDSFNVLCLCWPPVAGLMLNKTIPSFNHVVKEAFSKHWGKKAFPLFSSSFSALSVVGSNNKFWILF